MKLKEITLRDILFKLMDDNYDKLDDACKKAIWTVLYAIPGDILHNTIYKIPKEKE